MQMLKSPKSSVERALKNSLSPSCQRPLNLIMQIVWPSQFVVPVYSLWSPLFFGVRRFSRRHYTTLLHLLQYLWFSLRSSLKVQCPHCPCETISQSRSTVRHDCQWICMIELLSAPVFYFQIYCIFDLDISHLTPKRVPTYPWLPFEIESQGYARFSTLMFAFVVAVS